MRTRIAALLGAAMAQVAHAQSLENRLGECRTIAEAEMRLACFDAVAQSVEELATPAVPGEEPAVATAASREQDRGPLTAAWDLWRPAGRDAIDILPYHSSYVMPITYGDRTNSAPFTPPTDSMAAGLELDKEEAQFQLSFKLRLIDNLLGEDGDIWFGYTQRSFWQVYNEEESRVFRETNYEPELMLSFPVNYDFLGLRGGLVGVSLSHQSNGRDDPISRSWNRVIGMAGFETENMSLLARLWYRIPESDDDDDNPDIEDYMGQGDLLFNWEIGEHELEALLKSNFEFDDLKAGLQLSWSGPFPGTRAIRWYAQYYYGYGESMIDQEFLVNRVGVGVALAEWY